MSTDMNKGLVTLREARVSLCGSAAVLLEADGELALSTQRRIWRLAEDARGWHGVDDVQPCMNNLLVVLDPVIADPEAMAERVLAAWYRTEPERAQGRLVEFGVVYGGEHGFDLPNVAAHHGVDIETVVALHAAAEYIVFAPGSSPGFGYLFGLDPRLFTPRHKVPGLRPVGGSVTLGGAQAGLGGPRRPGGPAMHTTGWHTIGCVPDIPVPFDLNRDPILLLPLGTRIHFRVERIER